MTLLTLLAVLPLLIWLYLLIGRGRFWLADQRMPMRLPEPERWPGVAVVVPARNEAAVIAQSVGALLDQVYSGDLAIVVVDDHSEDETADILHTLAAGAKANIPVHVFQADTLPPRWSGKLWALDQGIRHAGTKLPNATYLLLTDADVRHTRHSIHRLVAKAEADRLDMVSLMVRLDCSGFWGRLLIPAFVFFFQKLYPFPWVNNPKRRTAAAAGGCILIRRSALDRAGGLAAIGHAIIDDCTLAAAVKRTGGRLWLGLANRVKSVRPYEGLAGIWNMVARSAYAQLNHSPWLLMGTLAGMALTYVMPPLALVAGLVLRDPLLIGLGAVVWLLMMVAYLPTLRYFGESWDAALALPAVAALFGAMTLSSAIRHWRGAGGQWKGRIYGSLARGGSDR